MKYSVHKTVACHVIRWVILYLAKTLQREASALPRNAEVVMKLCSFLFIKSESLHVVTETLRYFRM